MLLLSLSCQVTILILRQYTCPQIISWDPISWCTSMLFADCEHLENSIKRSWVEQALQNEHFLFDRPLPPKMANQFMLHDRETEGIRFLL